MSGNFRDRKKSGTIAQNIKRNGSYSEYHELEMVFTRKKSRAGENPESPPRTQPEIYIRELRTPSRKVFTQVVQYSQDLRVKICIIVLLV